MNNLSQIVPISDLPRKYLSIINKANSSSQPVIIFKRNKPVAGILSYKMLKSLMESQRKNEEKDALETIFSGEKDLISGKTKTLKSINDLWK